MSDWEVRRNPDGTIDEIVAHDVDLHLEQMDKGTWTLNVYAHAASEPFFQGDIYSKKRVTVFVEEGQDVYPKPDVDAIDEATPPSTENLSRTVAIEDESDYAHARPSEFIKFSSGEITP